MLFLTRFVLIVSVLQSITLAIPMSSSLQFLVGSEGSYVYTFSFNPSTKSLEQVTKSGNFTTPSWVEPSQNAALKGKVFYAASEEGGKILSLELQSDGTLTETGSAPTGGSPAHVHALKDGSGVVATNYLGGSAVFIPVDNSTGAIAVQASTIQSVLSNVTTNVGSVSPILKFTSPYSNKGPNQERQDASHPHQCIEGSNGNLYVPDLGSDRIWQLKRKGENELEITGAADGRSGVGPRHAALHSNGKYLYLITELAHEVFIYPVPFGGADVTALYPEGPTITPSQIPVELKPEMTAGEIILHPVNDRVLYISNRGQVDLNEKSGQDAKGDAVAVVTLNEAGDQIENVDIVPTDINFIRGMKITSDGKYLGLVGQKDGKVAVYETGGKYGEKIELVAKVDAGLNQPTDVTWI